MADNESKSKRLDPQVTDETKARDASKGEWAGEGSGESLDPNRTWFDGPQTMSQRNRPHPV